MTEEQQKTDSTLATDASTIIINPKENPMSKWYVVHTYSGHENKVGTVLKQRVESIGYIDKFFKVLIPQQQKIVVAEGKKRKVEERLFPGYILVNMILNDDTWHLVRSTRGVTGFVGTGSNPTPLPAKEVQALVRFMKTEEPKFEAKFQVGDSVKVTEGPFAEFLGKVEEVNEEQGKLKVLVSVFGRETPLELDFMQVKSL
jgi:transcriptional antiterminator NusG